jgi:hypothetical protein
MNPKRFFAELKRRNVYKVAVAYAIVGWLIMQIAATVVPALHLSDAITSAVVLLIAEALAVLKELEGKYEKHEAIGQDLAAVYAGLRENDQAFAWLEKDFQARSGLLAWERWTPPFEPLRSDPRYADLLRRMGLKP